jgi:fatty-acyl-CoA synthase
VLAELATGTVSLLVSPPHLTFELAANPAWEHTDVSGLRCVMTGGTTVPTRAIDRWSSRGVTVIQGYGQTEAGGNVALVRPRDAPGQSTCAGRPMPGWDVRIMSPAAHHTARPGEHGEIAVRGPSLMRKYWHNPQATAEVMRDGWLRTGDLGFVDARGYLHVTGRIKDVIVVGTSNVIPGDLEAVLADSPEIAAAAVVGRPDDKLGEVPVAFVVGAPGSQLSAERVMAMFNGRVAPYKQPRNVIFLDAMPLTSVGKPAKNALRALAALTG